MRVPEPVPSVTAVPPARRYAVPRIGAAAALAVATAILCIVVGTGWLDRLSGWGILGSGPHVADALPLRALAGQADQPLLRMLAGWVPTGVVAGLLLRAQRPGVRAALLGIPFWILSVAIADGEYALVHNLPTMQVLQSRPPAAAAFVATACVVTGASLVAARRP